MKLALVMFDNCKPAILGGNGLRAHFAHAKSLLCELIAKHPGQLSMIVMTEICHINLAQWKALVALMKQLGYPHFHYCHKDIPPEAQVGDYMAMLRDHMSVVVFSALPPDQVEFETVPISTWEVPGRGTRYNYAIVAKAGESRLAVTHSALSFGRDHPTRPGKPVLEEWSKLRSICDAAVGDLNVLPHFLFWAPHYEDGAYKDVIDWIVGPDHSFADFRTLSRDHPPIEDLSAMYPECTPHPAYTPVDRFDVQPHANRAGLCGTLGTHTRGVSCVATYLPFRGLPNAHRMSPKEANAVWAERRPKHEPELGDHFFKVLNVELPGFSVLGATHGTQ